jgi:hypothetical protein
MVNRMFVRANSTGRCNAVFKLLIGQCFPVENPNIQLYRSTRTVFPLEAEPANNP